MKKTFPMKGLRYVSSLLTLIVGFLLFYNKTQEPIGSLTAAILSAALVWISCIMLEWIVQIFIK